MFWAWSIVLSCFVIISLLVLGIIVLIVAKLMHKEKIADIATCFILWTIFPFILPFKAKKKELISKQIYSWILVVLAPIFMLFGESSAGDSVPGDPAEPVHGKREWMVKTTYREDNGAINTVLNFFTEYF